MTGRNLIPSLLRFWPRDAASSDASPGDPFLRLDTGALPFSTYLARAEVDGNVLIPYLTVAMEPNEYGAASGHTYGILTGHALVEAMWREAARSHRAVSSVGLASLERTVLPEDSALRHPPLAYCRKTAAYITPVCAACLGPLSTCRDEGLLRRAGLPSYRNTLSRFLHCPACAQDPARPPTFYTYSTRPVDGVAPGTRLRRRSELYRDLAPRLSAVSDSTPATGALAADAPAADALAADASEAPGGHACFRCPHRAACYPAGRDVNAPVPAEDLLFPVAYYDFFFLPLESLAFSFEETAALLGGAPLTELIPRLEFREALREPFSRQRQQFFFEGDESGLFPLEALYLKLVAFAGLTRGLLDLARQAKRPHLALSPGRARGTWEATGAPTPTRWGLSLKMADLLTTAPLPEGEPAASNARETIPEPSASPPVWVYPLAAPEAFLPEGMSRPQRESLRMRLRARELGPDRSSGGTRTRLVAELVSDLYRDTEHGRHDRVQLALPSPAGEADGTLFIGRKTGPVPEGFLFEGESRAVGGTSAAGGSASGTTAEAKAPAFDLARLPGSLSVDVTIDHLFAAPADLTGLGLLLLRLLLQNDRQDGSRLGRDEIEDVAESLPSPEGVLAAMARAGIAAGPEQVLFREQDRKETRASLPPALWEDALHLSLRLATTVPGWSLCGSQDDYPENDPARPLSAALEEIEALMDRARGGLLGSSGRNAVLQEVLTDFLTDLESAATPMGPVVEEDTTGRTVVLPARKKK